MKKALIIILSTIFIIALSSCNDENKGDDMTSADTSAVIVPVTKEDPYKDFTESGKEGTILENDFLKVVIAPDGTLSSAKSKDGKTVFFENKDRTGSFTLTLNEKESDIWKTDPESKENVTVSEKDAVIKHFKDGNKVKVVAVIHRENGSVALIREYSLDGGKINIEATVESYLSEGVVIDTVPLYLGGVESRRRAMNCLWPYKTGTLYKMGNIDNGSSEEDGGKIISESYPTPISMQTVILYDSDKTVSYTVEDKKAEYKTFFYKSEADRSASIWCNLMPFAAPYEEKSLAPIVIECFDARDWTKAADSYREFIIEAGWSKTPTESAKNFTGGNGWDLNTYLNNYLTKYTESAPASVSQTLLTSMKLIQNRTGLDYMWITGWHDGGFDTYYPDYEFSDMMGGEAGFIEGLSDIHSLGGKAIVYINAHMSDKESKWYNTKGENGKYGEICAIKKADGTVYIETYPTSGGAVDVAMCPSSKAFIDAILSAAEKVRSAGADAIYLDQISEMRSYLCFDPSHGHSTPATAYFEGYSKMLDGVSSVMDKYGEDWFLLCEGECDVYGKWIDVFCGYTDTNFLPLTRYTLPNKIVGRDLESETKETHFSSAFVLGEPFICHRYHVMQSKNYDNKNLKRFLELYKKHPEIYLSGRYVYQKGLSDGIPSSYEVGVMLGEDGESSGVTLYNSSSLGGGKITFTYTPPEGEIFKAFNAESGENVLNSDGSVSVSIESGKLISIIFEYK